MDVGAEVDDDGHGGFVTKMKTRKCLRCGGKMTEGMLSGWWLCVCGLFLDIQEYKGGAIVQYSLPHVSLTVPFIRTAVPKGTMLVMGELRHG